MNKEILEALEAKMLAIAKRVGDENAGFAGDPSSGEDAEGDFVLWEGAGRIREASDGLVCEWYGSPTERKSVTVCANVEEVLAWIDEMDKLTRE